MKHSNKQSGDNIAKHACSLFSIVVECYECLCVLYVCSSSPTQPKLIKHPHRKKNTWWWWEKRAKPNDSHETHTVNVWQGFSTSWRSLWATPWFSNVTTFTRKRCTPLHSTLSGRSLKGRFGWTRECKNSQQYRNAIEWTNEPWALGILCLI